MIYFLIFCNYILTHFNPADPQDMFWHIKQLQKEVPRGKILVVTLVFTAALLTIAASMIKKTYQEERKIPPSDLSKNQLRSYLVKASMAARKVFDQNHAEAIKIVLETYASQRNLTWHEKEIDDPAEYNFPVEFQIDFDTIKISFLETQMEVEAICGDRGCRVVIDKNGLIESAVYKIGLSIDNC